MTEQEKLQLQELVKELSAKGYDKSTVITKCKRLGYKDSTARRYYKYFVEWGIK